jgi:drug/metabolite transporter (DMT)-like permease
LEYAYLAGSPDHVRVGICLGWWHVFTARAYSLALASVVAPFEYVSLPISIMWGFLLWHQFPPVATWIGAFITLVSSLYTLYQGKKDHHRRGQT